MLPHRRITPVGRKERSIVPARSEYERLLEEVRLLQMRITELLEQELGLKPEDIRYQRENGWFFAGRVREVE